MVQNPFYPDRPRAEIDQPARVSWTIREAGPADASALAELERLSFVKPWSQKQLEDALGRSGRFRALAAVTRDVPEYGPALPEKMRGEEFILGYISWEEVLDEGDINNLAVHPSFRRRGVARALLREAVEMMRSRGVTGITLEVASRKAGARSLYEKAGFLTAGMRKGYYIEEGDDALLMKLDLHA